MLALGIHTESFTFLQRGEAVGVSSTLTELEGTAAPSGDIEIVTGCSRAGGSTGYSRILWLFANAF